MEIKTAASLAAAALGAVVFAGSYTVPAQAASVAPVTAAGAGLGLGVGNGDNDDEFFLALALQDFFDNDRRGDKDCDEDDD
ncbi:hypothetical protein [Streptosporangium pseudovulgare]|uniref:Uncharacterized protein n=1 Tax=Streptosporangium pseudovulgare TaxID=35765 RepID=A0ABQ2QP66_9ACTN|nr:hypothetical protein [Streptosporangium pseudovulgare]GGP90722.1 hypothetical protein GCM10010140_20530 [Streptosporangium pseudovulgare]